MASSTIIPNSDIVVRRDGVGDRAIVFMHGWIDDMHVWRPVIDELSAPGFETVQLDLAGFGDRTQANGPFTFDRFAADVLAVDPIITSELVASAVVARFDSAKTTPTEIQRSSHWPHIEQPSAVAAQISRFLANNLMEDSSVSP